MSHRRRVVLIQLPIPQPGLQPAKGNVPLAAGYLKLYAQQAGLAEHYDIEIFPSAAANTLSDQGLVEAILDLDPWLVGFTCYLWNIDRSLWIAEQLKLRRPELHIMLGGPEITADNAWVLNRPELDYAAIGEGEQTFGELLAALHQHQRPTEPIDGLFVAAGDFESRNSVTRDGHETSLRSNSPLAGTLPAFRKPLPKLDVVSSPYLSGILDAADEQMLLLETIRGCVFKCKFCYYPKSYDALYFLSEEKIEANLAHARDRGAREVILLDPTLNQRRDFPEFLKLLIRGNPGRQFTYFGELRAEGITPEIAQLLKAANFTEVEIGLQSIVPLAMELMDRRNNFKAFERGVRALMDVGIEVKVDLIIGLPGDTADSIRRGFHYIHDSGLYRDIQVFNLSVLPGTAFRQEAEQLGLRFQPRTPYYVYQTPTLQLDDFYTLMSEAEELFESEFDPHGPPELPELKPAAVNSECRLAIEPNVQRTFVVDFDIPESLRETLAPASERAQALTIWFRGSHLRSHRSAAAGMISKLLIENPHSTLQVIVEPLANPQEVTAGWLESLRAACFETTSYLDRFYSIMPGRTQGAKRLVLLLPLEERHRLGADWTMRMGQFATLTWRGGDKALLEEELELLEC